jgi:L-aminopeptidase/D-esterase-like protein
VLNLLTDVAGVAVGHATDIALGSGVTAILFAEPSVVSVSVGGGAPGLRDIAMLDPAASVERIDAVVLSGGSAYGLDAASGVQSVLRAQRRGLAFAGHRVPLVAQAILFDLAGSGDKDWAEFPPYRELGAAAASSARPDGFALGSVGAGTGATTATCKGGVGSASALTESGHRVGALAAVNAMGSATVGDGPHFWAAPFEHGREYGGLGWPRTFDLRLPPRLRARVPGTTLVLVATDASLSKPQAHRLASMARDGLARAIVPSHAPMDGDCVFAAATGARPLADAVPELTELGHVAAIVTARAIARGVFEAAALPHAVTQPAWRDLFAGHKL